MSALNADETAGRAFVAAVTHPLRSKIMVRLELGPACAQELADELGVPPNTIRYHLRILKRDKLVRTTASVARRNATESYFRGVPASTIVEDELYEQLSLEERRALTNHCLRQVARMISKFVSDGSTYEPHYPGTVRVVLELDERGWQELSEIQVAALGQVLALRRDAATRLRGSGEEGFEVDLSVLFLERARADGLGA
jgi:DNA-binding transcriptional ArsR family regulator